MEKDIKEIKELVLKNSEDIAGLTKVVTKNSNDISDLTKSVDLIAKTTATILETMATKRELLEFKLDTATNFNDLRTDLKSFKNDTNHSISELEEKVFA